MGEYADDVIQAGLDGNWSLLKKPSRPKVPRCNKCGKNYLYWKLEPTGNWVLYEYILAQAEYVRHTCVMKGFKREDYIPNR